MCEYGHYEFKLDLTFCEEYDELQARRDEVDLMLNDLAERDLEDSDEYQSLENELDQLDEMLDERCEEYEEAYQRYRWYEEAYLTY